MARNTQTKDQSAATRSPAYIAWNITDKGEKSFWTRVGAAWTHKDAKGLTLQLDMLPINGRIVLREPSTDTVEASN